ncbi:MAG: hypothetical protein GXY77_19575 [Fibrobacter sp.]|mgnify:CR=1 FL=1|nr:hypothetical protein [Fibrobacter sp.]
MKENIILYGATGYSGSLIAREAKKSGLKLILAGRNEKKLHILSKETGFPCKLNDLPGFTFSVTGSKLKII